MTSIPQSSKAASSPSGSTSEEISEGRCMLNSTSSSISSSANSKPSAALAAIPMWTPGEGRMSKPSPTVPRKNHESPVHGDSASLDSSVQEHEATSRRSVVVLSPENRWQQLRKTTLPDSFASREASRSSKRLRHGPSGVKFESRLSAARRAPASRQSSARPSDQLKYTLSQAKSLFGLTGTRAIAVSSLTTLRSRLNAKLSYATWMGILSSFRSNTALRGLDSTLSASVPTIGRSTPGALPSDEESQASSGSDVNEEPIQISSSGSEMEDNRLESDMSDQDSQPPTGPSDSEDDSQETWRSKQPWQRKHRYTARSYDGVEFEGQVPERDLEDPRYDDCPL